MKNILIFLSAVMVMFLISATTVSMITVKPALPKYVITDSFWSPASAAKYIKENTKNGYILHSISSQKEFSIVTMYKY